MNRAGAVAALAVLGLMPGQARAWAANYCHDHDISEGVPAAKSWKAALAGRLSTDETAEQICVWSWDSRNAAENAKNHAVFAVILNFMRHSREADIRYAAASAVDRICASGWTADFRQISLQEPALEPALIEASDFHKEADPRVRAVAAAALKTIPYSDAAANAAVISAAGDPDPVVRREAVWALSWNLSLKDKLLGLLGSDRTLYRDVAETIMKASRDSDRDVRYQAVEYGLSTLTFPDNFRPLLGSDRRLSGEIIDALIAASRDQNTDAASSAGLTLRAITINLGVNLDPATKAAMIAASDVELKRDYSK